MRVLLYEWCSSGGLVGDDPTIAREGRMMLEAVAADADKDARLDVEVLVDAARPIDLPPRAHRIAVKPGDDIAPLVTAARAADWTIIVAPESDGILRDRVRAVRAGGGRVLAPSDRVITIAGDKQATIDSLAAAGVPVPAGRSLAAAEPIPRHFRLPAVRKARSGCGCEDVTVLRSRDAPTADVPTRLEAFAPGVPVGLSLICGLHGATPLPAMRQRFSAGDEPRYVGSDLLLDEQAAARATGLARRAAAALAADLGWLGIDLILGARPDGRDDRVLEINPRITTSIVGQSRLFASSLVAAMIAAAAGAASQLRPLPRGDRPGSFYLADHRPSDAFGDLTT
jgi:predicted ATP-grasp superfamily ATP-dependent carboligase